MKPCQTVFFIKGPKVPFAPTEGCLSQMMTAALEKAQNFSIYLKVYNDRLTCQIIL